MHKSPPPGRRKKIIVVTDALIPARIPPRQRRRRKRPNWNKKKKGNLKRKKPFKRGQKLARKPTPNDDQGDVDVAVRKPTADARLVEKYPLMLICRLCFAYALVLIFQAALITVQVR